jgi:hypothetical protein
MTPGPSHLHGGAPGDGGSDGGGFGGLYLYSPPRHHGERGRSAPGRPQNRRAPEGRAGSGAPPSRPPPERGGAGPGAGALSSDHYRHFEGSPEGHFRPKRILQLPIRSIMRTRPSFLQPAQPAMVPRGMQLSGLFPTIAL